MNKNVICYFIEQEDPILGTQLAMDLRLLSEQATVADFLAAQSELAEQQLADCRGCSGCCRERAPLIAADIAALAKPGSAFPVHEVIAAYAEMTVIDGVIDFTLRRDGDGPCSQLDRRAEQCSIWPQRPFVCRSHFCLPRSFRLDELRQQVTNNGENELARLFLAEEAIGAPAVANASLVASVNPKDYPPGAVTGKTDYAQLLIRDCVDDELWQLLFSEER